MIILESLADSWTFFNIYSKYIICGNQLQQMKLNRGKKVTGKKGTETERAQKQRQKGNQKTGKTAPKQR